MIPDSRRSAVVLGLGRMQPETVVRWDRKGFRLYWRSISKRGPGRPPISAEVHSRNSESPSASPPSLDTYQCAIATTINASGGKRSFAITKNGIAAMDFLVVPSVRFRLLYP